MKGISVTRYGVLAFCCLYFSLCIVYFKCAGHLAESPRYWFLLLLLSLFILSACTVGSLYRRAGKIDKDDIGALIIIAVVLACVRTALQTDNDMVVMVLSAVIAAYLFNRYLLPDLWFWMLWYVHGIFIFQLLLAYVQLTADLHAGRLHDVVIGCWNSTEELTGYLLASYPLLLFSMLRHKWLHDRMLVQLCLWLAVMLAAGVLLYVIGSTPQFVLFIFQNAFFFYFLLRRFYRNALQKAWFADAVFLKSSLFIAAGIAACIPGRNGLRQLAAYRVCINKVNEYGYRGVGLGRFPEHYPVWQAEYVDSNDMWGLAVLDRLQDVRLIDNEYLILGCEVGLLGLLLLYFAMVLVLRADHSTVHDERALLLRLFVLSFCVELLECHLFHMPAALFLFIVVCMLFLEESYLRAWQKLKKLWE